LNTLAFDIETIPDVEFGRLLYDGEGLDDADVAKIMQFKQKQARNTDFLPLPQHRIVVISAVLRDRQGLRVFSLGSQLDGEKEIVQRFFDGIERYSPELVSWNGSGFDLPVLHYRALRHSVQASRYWETGDSDREFRYNNYLSRYHWRHVDVMDVLSGFQPGARASLDHIATLLGFPGKLGMSGAQVWNYYQAGKAAEIDAYCETDAVNTYLVYLRFQLMRGLLDPARYETELDLVRATLSEADGAHWREFLDAWQANDR
jgi:predicted PolB exonuclease-like 3'-5' exonuclease